MSAAGVVMLSLLPVLAPCCTRNVCSRGCDQQTVLQCWGCDAGNVHCLGCGKAFKEHTTLAQHLKDKHQGRNASTGTARTGLTLGDIMAQAHAKQAAAAPAKAAAAAAERQQKQYSAFTPGDSRGMREYLKVCCSTAVVSLHSSCAASCGLLRSIPFIMCCLHILHGCLHCIVASAPWLCVKRVCVPSRATSGMGCKCVKQSNA